MGNSGFDPGMVLMARSNVLIAPKLSNLIVILPTSFGNPRIGTVLAVGNVSMIGYEERSINYGIGDAVVYDPGESAPGQVVTTTTDKVLCVLIDESTPPAEKTITITELEFISLGFPSAADVENLKAIFDWIWQSQKR